eukprot:CAMPEP_0202725930 /NCGR_PEP_ID=MMETSP1385-20130828/184351_1 /ASSEMBLY_ACC=CAM_ASM_000861 /TAXON_ID=933848 /ORGANISM="Elphidium margaritaceum" /LENGTH=748 /DNA_ID=CAMNT_0049392135 /DNA_START=109 /DNA_END=2355 /DNA_ORIENTATION=+
MKSTLILLAAFLYYGEAQQLVACNGQQSVCDTLAAQVVYTSGFTISLYCSDDVNFPYCLPSGCSSTTECDAYKSYFGMTTNVYSTCVQADGLCTYDYSCTSDQSCANKFTGLTVCEISPNHNVGVCVAPSSTTLTTTTTTTPNSDTTAITSTTAAASCASHCPDTVSAVSCDPSRDSTLASLIPGDCQVFDNECLANCYIHDTIASSGYQNVVQGSTVYGAICLSGQCPTPAPTLSTATSTTSSATDTTTSTSSSVSTTGTTSVSTTCPSAGRSHCPDTVNAVSCDPSRDSTLATLIPGDCQVFDNECLANCYIDDTIASLDTTYQTMARNYGVYGKICQSGQCPTTDATTATPATTTSGTSSSGTVTSDPVSTSASSATSTTASACSSACATDDVVAAYCKGPSEYAAYLPFDCLEADNLCLAKCAVDDAVVATGLELSAVDGYLATSTYGSLDGLKEQQCDTGTCPDTAGGDDDPTTTAADSQATDVDDNDATGGGGDDDVTTTEVRTTVDIDGPCANGYALTSGCTDQRRTGCSLQLDVSLDFCVVDLRFPRALIQNGMKQTMQAWIGENIDGYTSWCTQLDDIDVEVYNIDLSDDSRAYGSHMPSATECSELEQICNGNTTDTDPDLNINIDFTLGFFCGAAVTRCADVETVYTRALALLASDRAGFGTWLQEKIRVVGTTGDSVCARGLGFGEVVVSVDSATLTQRDEDGEVVSVHDITGGSGASNLYYGVAVCVSLLVAFFF